jgi:hypothetical protein
MSSAIEIPRTRALADFKASKVKVIKQEWVRIDPKYIDSFNYIYKKTQNGYIALCNVEQWYEGNNSGIRHKILEYSDLPEYSRFKILNKETMKEKYGRAVATVSEQMQEELEPLPE